MITKTFSEDLLPKNCKVIEKYIRISGIIYHIMGIYVWISPKMGKRLLKRIKTRITHKNAKSDDPYTKMHFCFNCINSENCQIPSPG